MNKINHKPAQDIICDIILRIQKQFETALKTKEQRVALETDTRLAEEFRSKKIAEINSAYLSGLQETRTFIAEKLEKVGELEKENENILDLDVPEFNETLATINATKGNLPEDIIFSIRDKFQGQYQVMNIIKAAIESYGVDLAPFKFNDYTAPAENKISTMVVNAKNIEISEDASFISLRDLLKDVVYFGRCRGMIFSDEFVAIDAKIEDAISDYLVRSNMFIN